VEFQVASCFKAKGVDTKSETSHTVNDISREVKKHVPGKPIRRMGKQRSLCRQCTPLVISVLLLRSIGWFIRKRCPKLQVSVPEVHDKLTEINRLTYQ
jgi:hypothetical protein